MLMNFTSKRHTTLPKKKGQHSRFLRARYLLQMGMKKCLERLGPGDEEGRIRD